MKLLTPKVEKILNDFFSKTLEEQQRLTGFNANTLKTYKNRHQRNGLGEKSLTKLMEALGYTVGISIITKKK